MPFRHVKDSYQPEQLNKLTEAFDLVWPQIMPANGAATESGMVTRTPSQFHNCLRKPGRVRARETKADGAASV